MKLVDEALEHRGSLWWHLTSHHQSSDSLSQLLEGTQCSERLLLWENKDLQSRPVLWAHWTWSILKDDISYSLSGCMSTACESVFSWDEGAVFQTEWQARAIYRLFLHVAPGGICSPRAVCFLGWCCLRNSSEVVFNGKESVQWHSDKGCRAGVVLSLESTEVRRGGDANSNPVFMNQFSVSSSHLHIFFFFF